MVEFYVYKHLTINDKAASTASDAITSVTANQIGKAFVVDGVVAAAAAAAAFDRNVFVVLWKLWMAARFVHHHHHHHQQQQQ